jgi:antitoxin VapB
LVELGLDFCRKLRADGHTAEGKPADKAFRDGLFDDS